MRLLIVKRGCKFCKEWIKAVNRVNLKLPFERRIKIIDNYQWEELGLNFYPITNRFSKETFDSYPFCYLDGISVGQANFSLAKSFLNGFFKEEYLTQNV